MALGLHTRILIGGGLGAGLGIAAHLAWGESSAAADPAPPLPAILEYGTKPAAQVFLRLLFMLVAPLIFAALALGVAGLGDLRSLGRIGLKTLYCTVGLSTVAVLLGVVLTALFQPGAGISAEQRVRLLAESNAPASAVIPAEPPSVVDVLVCMVPENPLKAAANGDYLALMFFALAVGAALAGVKSTGGARFREVLEGVYDVAIWLIHKVLALAPIGVFALLFNLTAELGYEILQQLAAYVGVVLLGLAIHQCVVFSLAVRYLGGMSPRAFFRAIQEAMITAFSTASSSATLPTTLRVAEEKLRLPPQVARFVLTIGASANQNGTALFEGVTVLFLAQVFGVELTVLQQVLVVVVCVLAGVGTAGVPSGSLAAILAILAWVGIPAEGIGLILGVNHFLDMCRTTLNVTGDLAAAVVIARGETPG
ncbi:MAG: dicarboxylate/amino acid:cation symporter [Planctomycetes bacterium]|nr:dicarboxylate/amino acid:cation symporter [Planctomycetota bacterium]